MTSRVPDEVDMPDRDGEWWKSAGPRHWLVTGWRDGFRQVMETMSVAGAMPEVSYEAAIPEAGAWSGWPSPVWCRMTLESNEKAEVWAGSPGPTVQLLAQLVAGDPALPESECRATFLELLNQTASSVAGVISSKLGRRVAFSPCQVAGPPARMDYGIQIQFPIEGVTHVMAIVPGVELMEALGEVEQAPPTAALAPAAAQPAAPTPTVSIPIPGNLDLLLEVELPVSVTFGRTQLPLKDVLKLSSGSIVELNRLANEPVEVLINNCVIARGEVVVVDGNYGIRVTEIVSRQERIRSIF